MQDDTDHTPSATSSKAIGSFASARLKKRCRPFILNVPHRDTHRYLCVRGALRLGEHGRYRPRRIA